MQTPKMSTLSSKKIAAHSLEDMMLEGDLRTISSTYLVCVLYLRQVGRIPLHS